MQRGTQGHVAAPRGPPRRLRGKLYIHIYLYSYVIYMGISAFCSSKGYSNPLKRRIIAFNILRVGLSSTEFTFDASDVAIIKALDRAGAEPDASIEWTQVH